MATKRISKHVRRDQDKQRDRDNKIKRLHEENKKLKSKIKSLSNYIKHTPNPKEEEPIKKPDDLCPACGSKLEEIIINRLDGRFSISVCKCGHRESKKAN